MAFGKPALEIYASLRGELMHPTGVFLSLPEKFQSLVRRPAMALQLASDVLNPPSTGEAGQQTCDTPKPATRSPLTYHSGVVPQPRPRGPGGSYFNQPEVKCGVEDDWFVFEVLGIDKLWSCEAGLEFRSSASSGRVWTRVL